MSSIDLVYRLTDIFVYIYIKVFKGFRQRKYIVTRRYGTLVIQGDSVFEQTFHPELVEEDKRYEYEGKLDDTPPGVRLNYIGRLSDRDVQELFRGHKS